MNKSIFAMAVLSAAIGLPSMTSAKEAKALKGLMITGGCCHDYKNQKNILAEGINSRLPVEWTISHEQDQGKNEAYLSQKDWAKGYDFVLYNHCFAHQSNVDFVDSVAAAHEKGLPALFLHCAMHSYHWKIPEVQGGDKTWPKLLGVVSRNHGPKARITVKKDDKNGNHPAIQSLPDGWQTPEGELYNVNKVMDSATVLAWGENGKAKKGQPCIWVNTYGKGKVFGTTIGHHNSTMSAKEYLDFVTDGLRWTLEK